MQSTSRRLYIVLLGSILFAAVTLTTGCDQAAPNVPVATQNPHASLAPTPPTPTLRPQLATPTPALATSNVPDVKVSVVAVATPAPVAAKDFAALNAQLAQKVAAMNQAQLKVIALLKARAQGRSVGLALQIPDLTDEAIKDLAGKAMDVAIDAEKSGSLAVKQGGGADQAIKAAEAYANMARSAYALVIEAQNIRKSLEQGLMTAAQAVERVASYGSGLWNNAVTDGTNKGNPFTPQTKSAETVQSLNPNAAAQVQSQVSTSDSTTWIAQSVTATTKTIDVPAAQSRVNNPFDPQVKAALTSANGQSDGNKAQQVASSNLQALGAKPTTTDPSKPTQLQVPISPVAVAGSEQVKAGNIPTFPKGNATVASQNKANGDPFMQAFGLNGDQPPTDQGQTAVQEMPALVNLSLSNIVISNVNKRPKGSSTFEADVNFTFAVNWNTTLAAPRLSILCNSGLNNAVTQASGTLNLSASGLLILYPGTLDVYCYANSTNGQLLGSVSAAVLVGDAAEATTRALQVETESAILNITLTADAKGTLSAQQTQTASAMQTQNARGTQTAAAQATINALSTEVAKTATAEFRLTAAAFETARAKPTVPPPAPTATQTFAPKVVDNIFHRGDVFSVSTKVVLQRGRLYRFTFSGKVNLINPTRSVTASQLPDHVNGVAVPASGIVVIQGTGGVATITCGSGTPDPKDPGGYAITVEDLGPL